MSLLLAWYYRSKGVKVQTKYKAHKEGTQRFMLGEPRERAMELYDRIGEARSKNKL